MENFIRFFHKRYTINQKGEIVKANGHKVSAVEVFKVFRDIQEDAGNEVSITEDDVSKYVAEHIPELESDEPEFNLRDFVRAYLMEFANPKREGVKQLWRIGPAWRTIERVGAGVPVPSDLRQLQVSIRAYAIDRGVGKGAKLDDIRCILEDLAAKANDERVASIVSKIMYNPASVPIADEAFDKLHKVWKIKQSPEILKTILRHWMWQVKRKLLGLETRWSIWPNFYGGTAIGKTTFLNTLASPFEDFALTTSISKLLDEERQMVKLTNSYVINLDELSVNNREVLYADTEGQLGKDQQATLKSLLTQTKMQTRLMGGQSQATRRITFSAISSANEHLYDIIYDDKTMRRYFEFECLVDKITDFTDLEDVKKHVIDMWQSVDESIEEGYWNQNCPTGIEIAREQSKYYPSNTTTGMWVREAHVIAGTPEDHDKIVEMYDEYRDFCKERGHMCKGYGKWLVDIKHLVEGSVQGEHTYIKIQPEDK